MGKSKKKQSKKPAQNAADKRPWQVTALSILHGLSALLNLYEWFFYVTNHIVGGSSVPVPAEAIPVYRIILLVMGSLCILLCFLVFFGVKAGFWITAVLYSLNGVLRLLSLDFLKILFSALCLYFLFCESTRIYFRIGQFKAFGPRKSKGDRRG